MHLCVVYSYVCTYVFVSLCSLPLSQNFKDPHPRGPWMKLGMDAGALTPGDTAVFPGWWWIPHVNTVWVSVPQVPMRCILDLHGFDLFCCELIWPAISWSRVKGTKGLIDYLSAVANFQGPTSLEQVFVFYSSGGQSLIRLWDPEGSCLLYTLLLEDSVLDKLGVIGLQWHNWAVCLRCHVQPLYSPTLCSQPFYSLRLSITSFQIRLDQSFIFSRLPSSWQLA